MKKKIGERGKQRQGSTRSRVSRSSTGEAFEDPDGRKGSSAGHPGHAAGEMAPLQGDTLKTSGWEPAVQKRRGKEGGSPAGGWGGTRAAPRAAPCPGHPGTPRCSEPDSVAEQDASNSRRGGAAGSTSPDPPCPSLPSACRPDSAAPGVPAGTTHSPGATSSELTAPPTNTAAESTADPGSPHGAIAASCTLLSPAAASRSRRW